MSITVKEVGLERAGALIAYLAPYESKALFLLCNLKDQTLPFFIYEAWFKGQLVGVGAFYPAFASFALFSELPKAARELAKSVMQAHSVEMVLGVEAVARPVCEEFFRQGKKLSGDPKRLFLELKKEDFKPFTVLDAKVRPFETKDLDAVAILSRELDEFPFDGPVREEERIKTLASPLRSCLEIGGQVASTACSNGLALTAFQILGVATAKEFRKRGYARAVCSHLIGELFAKGAQNAVLFTGRENAAARKCYAHLGFRQTGIFYMANFTQ